jgi:very-short-patch-repair endonuclease
VNTPINQSIQRLVEARGWDLGTTLENRVCLILSSFGFRPEQVAQQYRVGRYRLDFAAPDVKVAIEADGWVHRSPETAAKDAERDSWLRSQGWLVLRVDDRHGEESLKEQMVWPARVIRGERDALGVGKAVWTRSAESAQARKRRGRAA